MAAELMMLLLSLMTMAAELMQLILLLLLLQLMAMRRREEDRGSLSKPEPRSNSLGEKAVLPQPIFLLPNRDLWQFPRRRSPALLGKTCQNLKVSSPAPVARVRPSGDLDVQRETLNKKKAGSRGPAAGARP